MKKKRLVLTITIFVICIAIVTAIGALATGGGPMFRAGEGLRETLDDRSGEVAAMFRDQEIQLSAIKQHRELYEMGGAQNLDDRTIVDRIVENLLLKEEAEQRSITVSQDDVESMLNSVLEAFEIEDGQKLMDEYLAGADMTKEEYLELLRDILPGVILQQRVKDEIGREWCEANGYEFTKVNPPDGMLEAEQEYIDALLEQHRDEITYYVD